MRISTITVGGSVKLNAVENLRTTKLLQILGVKYPTRETRMKQGRVKLSGCWRFWDHFEELDLLNMLHSARANYRDKMKRLHPDKPGGNEQDATRINLAWETLRDRFSKKGYELL